MKSRRGLRLRLEHILKGIDRIEHLTAGKTVEDYLVDEGLREMIERNVARISEAARFVPDDVRARYSDLPWRRIVGIGNVIRHDYDEIDDRVMWDTATEKLLPLKEGVARMLREIEEGAQQ
jgi:uncharacterized protein with HEPN domain